jgi:TolB-like protein
MKKSMCLLGLVFLGAAFLFASPSVAVLDFSPGNYCGADEASFMTAVFRDELVRTGRAEVVDRGNMEKIIEELKFQMSDWANPARVKRFGQMTGADNLITGRFDMLGNQLYLIVQMTDVETARIVHSSRIVLATLQEYDYKVKAFAGEFAAKFPQENRFIGSWDVTGIDNYSFNIVFMNSNTCLVTASSPQNGVEIVEETRGSWSYDNNILRVNANFPNSKIRYLGRINWSGVYTFNNSDNSSFNMQVIPPGGTAPVRASFNRTGK